MIEEYVKIPRDLEYINILYNITISPCYAPSDEIRKTCYEIEALIPGWKRAYQLKYARRGKRMPFDRNRHERQYRDAINARIHIISQLQFWEQLAK